MKALRVIFVLAALLCGVGCATKPASDPFTDPPPELAPAAKERRSKSGDSTANAEFIACRPVYLKDEVYRMIYWTGDESKPLYPERDFGPLYDSAHPVDDVLPGHSAAMRRYLEKKGATFEDTDKIYFPVAPPAVLRLSSHSYPIVFEGRQGTLEAVAFIMKKETILSEIYSLTFASDHDFFEDRQINEIRDIITKYRAKEYEK